MGNIRSYFKCDVCGYITLVRAQYGWLDSHPIRYTCGHCKILIKGTATLDQENADFRIDIENAIFISPENEANFYIETSGELLTEKLQPFDAQRHWYSPPPFFESLWAMNNTNNLQSGHENFERFKRNVLNFLYMIKNDWHKIRRINELWQNDNEKYLVQEVHNILPKKQFPMNNKLENLRGVHFLTRYFLQPIIDYKHNEMIFRELKSLLEQNPSNLLELSSFFNGHFRRYEKRILRIMEHFTEVFKFLIPAYGLTFYVTVNEELFREKGMTTAAFEDIKEFYIDTYEVVAELLPIIVAYNNLKYRNDYKKMSSVKPQYDFERFFEIHKGKKIEYIDGTEIFDKLILENAIDNKIRNAIGHNTYEFDGITQEIKYDPVGKNKPSDIQSMFLVEFAGKCLSIFQTVVQIWELIYQTEKHVYVSQGMKPVSPDVFINEFSKLGIKKKKELRDKRRQEKRGKKAKKVQKKMQRKK
ncbi:hypothetical protein FE782_21775 [Paenibacillus antri]|uniref:Uncharacterized protein n=1 Tax=Paenibacillus antri TaxID=2582848 RepID=A0A5R9G9B9_9BACL|nr:hypothetical protein [Paenibacillus antri]TLS49978.1 hypothetical protein FE782_21775 [Paenibacillus antri]